MELVIKTVTGKKLIIEVEQNDRIENIKLQIERKEGIPLSKQKLIYLNQELNNDKTINSYSIKNNETIYLSIASDYSILIFVNYGKDKYIPLEVEPATSIGKIKSMIEEIKGFEQNKQLLVVNQSILEDNQIINNIPIEPNSYLYLVYPSNSRFIILVEIVFNKNDPKDIGRYFPIEVKDYDLIENLKAKIEDREKISISQQKLLFAGALLENGKTIKDYSISRYSPIKLVIK